MHRGSSAHRKWPREASRYLRWRVWAPVGVQHLVEMGVCGEAADQYGAPNRAIGVTRPVEACGLGRGRGTWPARPLVGRGAKWPPR